MHISGGPKKVAQLLRFYKFWTTKPHETCHYTISTCFKPKYEFSVSSDKIIGMTDALKRMSENPISYNA